MPRQIDTDLHQARKQVNHQKELNDMTVRMSTALLAKFFRCHKNDQRYW
jgi:hypothetical protein